MSTLIKYVRFLTVQKIISILLGEAGLFEEAINKYGKDFSDIQKDFVSTTWVQLHINTVIIIYISVKVLCVFISKLLSLQLPWKSITSIVEYYYMWKTTDRYVRQVSYTALLSLLHQSFSPDK